MGLLKAGIGAMSGVLADQWRDYFYCESLDADTLAVRGEKRQSGRSSNKKGSDNVISNGSIINVNVGQCALIIEGGKVVELCAEPGEYVYDTGSEPSIFYGNLGENIKKSFAEIGKRFTFGAEAGKDQKVYYFNTKEIMGNKYGTPAPVPFRIMDEAIGFPLDIKIRCHGEYSYRITNPMLFYTNVSANIEGAYTRDQIDSQLKSALLKYLQTALFKISQNNIYYAAIPAYAVQLGDELNELLSSEWRDKRGIEIVDFGVSGINASEEDEAKIQAYQKNAAMGRDQNLLRGHMAGSSADAMVAAASNEAGAAMGFMGMGMAQNMMGGMSGLFQGGGAPAQNTMVNQQVGGFGGAAPAAAPAQGGWTCECGTTNSGKFCQSCGKPQPAPAGSWTCECGTANSGKFCQNCGKPQPAPAEGWTCGCGTVNQGKFCQNCGTPKPAGAPLYKCDKCGWTPEDPANPPKFCPECGDIFDENDR